MDFDQLRARFFDTTDLSAMPHEHLLAGVETLRTQLDLDGEDRLAIWCLLHMLGAAPEPKNAFDEEADREAAIEFMHAIDEDN